MCEFVTPDRRPATTHFDTSASGRRMMTPAGFRSRALMAILADSKYQALETSNCGEPFSTMAALQLWIRLLHSITEVETLTRPNKDPAVRPRGLSAQQQADIVAFLKRPLTDPRVAAELPPFDRPTLYMDSTRVPQVTGTGRAGSGGFVPQIMAISPPLAGNPNFTVSVSGALGNAEAVLVLNSTDPGAGLLVPSSGSLARITTTTQNTGNGNGWASVTLPLPDTFWVTSRTFFGRWYITDPSALRGFSVSPAIQFTVFGNTAFP